MAKVSPEEIAKFKALAKKNGMDLSSLTEPEIVRQVEILKGGIYQPAEDDLDEIRARAKNTEAVVLKTDNEVIALLQKAHSDLQRVEGRGSSRKAARTSGATALEKVAKRMGVLKRALLAHPPSLLRPELQESLRKVEEWSGRAQAAMKKGSTAANRTSKEILQGLRALVERLRTLPPRVP